MPAYFIFAVAGLAVNYLSLAVVGFWRQLASLPLLSVPSIGFFKFACTCAVHELWRALAPAKFLTGESFLSEMPVRDWRSRSSAEAKKNVPVALSSFVCV